MPCSSMLLECIDCPEWATIEDVVSPTDRDEQGGREDGTQGNGG